MSWTKVVVYREHYTYLIFSSISFVFESDNHAFWSEGLLYSVITLGNKCAQISCVESAVKLKFHSHVWMASNNWKCSDWLLVILHLFLKSTLNCLCDLLLLTKTWLSKFLYTWSPGHDSPTSLYKTSGYGTLRGRKEARRHKREKSPSRHFCFHGNSCFFSLLLWELWSLGGECLVFVEWHFESRHLKYFASATAFCSIALRSWQHYSA